MNKGLPVDFLISYFLKGIRSIAFPPTPIFVTFFITAKCNARCKHCFYWQRLNKIDNELSIGEIEKISSTMPPFPKLLLSGGEPFLRQDIDTICEVFYKRNKVKQITIPTNGLVPEIISIKMESILKKCKRCFIQLQISLDGLGKLHDEIRGVRGAFRKVMETFKMLKRLEQQYRNFEINFCFTYSSLNQFNYKQTYNFLKAKWGKELYIILVRRPLYDERLLQIDLGKYYQDSFYFISNGMKRKEKTLPEILFYVRYQKQREIIKNLFVNSEFRFRCRAGSLTVVINEVGEVYPCESKCISFGSLRKESYDFRKIWYGQVAKEFRKTQRVSYCKCTHETNLITNISFSLDFYLDFIWRLIKMK